MDKTKVLADIDEQISKLETRKNIFGVKMNNFYGVLTPGNIDNEIKYRKYFYWICRFCGVLLFLLLSVAVFLDLFKVKTFVFSDISISIVFTITTIVAMFNYSRDLENLKMIKYLFELKAKIEEEA